MRLMITTQDDKAHRIRLLCLNDGRCRGKYRRPKGLRAALHDTKWNAGRSDIPWRNRWHFRGRQHAFLGDPPARKDGAANSVLIKIGRERIRIKFIAAGYKSIITGRTRFHPEKHRVDFVVHSYWNGHGYEFDIACNLDGKQCIDWVKNNYVDPIINKNGKWECDSCYETGHEDAGDGYVREQFETKEALILDHLQPVFKGLEYLYSSSLVAVWLSDPEELNHTSSGVWLREEGSCLIPIGRITLAPPSKYDQTLAWIHQVLAGKMKRLESTPS